MRTAGQPDFRLSSLVVNMEPTKRLTGKQTKALDALLDGANVQTAAERAGVNRKTLGRWLQEPDFWRAYQLHSNDALQLASRRLTNKLDGAVELLGDVMEDDEAPAGVRLRAAQLVVDGALRLLESADFAERLAALEARMENG